MEIAFRTWGPGGQQLMVTKLAINHAEEQSWHPELRRAMTQDGGRAVLAALGETLTRLSAEAEERAAAGRRTDPEGVQARLEKGLFHVEHRPGIELDTAAIQAGKGRNMPVISGPPGFQTVSFPEEDNPGTGAPRIHAGNGPYWDALRIIEEHRQADAGPVEIRLTLENGAAFEAIGHVQGAAKPRPPENITVREGPFLMEKMRQTWARFKA